MRQSPLRRLAGVLVATALVGSFALHSVLAQERTPARPADAAPQDPYRLTRNLPGEAKPVILNADEVATWTEKDARGEHLAVLLHGTVLVQQSIAHARFQQGFAWVDLRQYKESGLLHVLIYGEGEAQVDDGLGARPAPRVLLDLTTRGELRWNAHKGKVVQQSRAADPVAQRARAFGLGSATSPPGASPQQVAQQTGFQQGSPAGKTPTAPGSLPQVELPAFMTPGPSTPPATVTARSPVAPGTGVQQASFEPGAAGGTLGDSPAIPGQEAPANPAISPLPVSLPGGIPGGPSAGPGPPSGVSVSGQPGSVPGVPAPGAPGVPAPLPPPSRATPPPPGPPAPTQVRNFTVAPRRGQSFNIVQDRRGKDMVVVVTGGVILTVRNAPNVGLLDLEADRLVIWYRGDNQKLLDNTQVSQEQEGNHVEFYLSGNVELRSQGQNKQQGERTIRADELYYDVDRNVAVAIKARLEMRQPKVPDPVIMTAAELLQLNLNTFELTEAEAFSSKLPSNPGFKVYMATAHVEDQTVPWVSIFGRPVLDRKTGQPLQRQQTMVTATNVFVELEDVPFFYTPYLRADARNPLGPVQEFNFGYSRIYGPTFSITFDMYQLLGIQPPPQTAWRMNLDYLGYRGPAAGLTYDSFRKEFFGIDALNTMGARGYVIDDRNFDILGGPRPMNDFNPTAVRGWLQLRDIAQEMPNGFSVISQAVGISDRNFVEQYFKRIWDTDVNQATFTYVKQQQDNWAWSALVQGRTRAWITETNWFPRLDGWLIGQSFFDLLTYNAHANVAAASLQVTNGTQQTVSPTDRYDTTGRFDLMQDLSLPFKLGAFKIVPYGMLDLTQYTNDLDGNDVGRVWVAGGVRGSIPFSRIYSGIQSDLWNINGINHKVVASANYFYSWTNESYLLFPQLDRLNDDATDQALRDIRPLQPYINPGAGSFLITSNLFQPQVYAIQNLLLSRVDTLSTIEELQLNLRQRWQTKRGYPGFQHITDWMTLNLSATFFPNPGRDDFGEPWSYLQGEWLWNIGDRTALESTAWVDPINNGPHVYTFGAFFNRPDRTNFYIGYRQIDPLQSRLVTASATYVFSPKYAGTASSSYDFGTGLSLSNTVLFTRIGSDLTVSLGFTYNAIQNSFGAVVQVVPNLVPAGKVPTLSGGGGGSFMGR